MHIHILFRLHSRSDAGSSVKVRVHRWLHQPSRSRTSGWRSWWRAIEQLFGALSKLCNVVQYGTTAASCRSYALHGTSVRCITVAVIPRSSWNNCFTENYNFWIRNLEAIFHISFCSLSWNNFSYIILNVNAKPMRGCINYTWAFILINVYQFYIIDDSIFRHQHF